MNQGKRKYPALDVVKMYSTLTLEHWKSVLTRAVKTNNSEKLIAYRYGLQAGLADAVSKGLGNEKLDFWVIKRCRDVEKCMKYVLRKRHPNPFDNINPNKDRIGYVAKAIEAKKKRDYEFEMFLKKSNF